MHVITIIMESSAISVIIGSTRKEILDQKELIYLIEAVGIQEQLAYLGRKQ